MSEEVRNWAELQRDVLLLIFQKLGAVEILFAAQYVCSSWRRLSLDPQLWRCVDMRISWDSFYSVQHGLEDMAKVAIDRSHGQMIEFSVEYCGTDELLQHLSKSDDLKFLRLRSCCSISDSGMIEIAKKIPKLEELDISYCGFSKEVLENVGRLCRQLKSLQLNCHGCRRSSMLCDEEALAIATNMPELHHLQLCGHMLTDYGLQAVLDGCTRLQSLDIRQCFCLNLDDGLGKRCVDQIKDLRLPNHYTDEHYFAPENGEFLDLELPSDDELYEYADFDGYSGDSLSSE